MKLSVVVTIVDGGAALQRCLEGLAIQDNAPVLEVIVPYDSTVANLGPLRARFSKYQFLDCGVLGDRRDPYGLAGQHELFDRRRSVGLAAATGDLVALLEDRGVPHPSWAANMMQAHQAPPACVGGAVVNGRNRMLNWAVYFCDFGRYQPPFEAGTASYVTDVNLAYKRAALELTRDVWCERYHETSVHWALTSRGHDLKLVPEVVVEELRDDLSLSGLVRERIAWGRLFAYTRVGKVAIGRRAMLIALTPMLPVVLFWRLLRQRLEKRVTLAPFVKAAPAIVVLLVAWSVGELIGYVTGSPG